jgi:DNA primase
MIYLIIRYLLDIEQYSKILLIVPSIVLVHHVVARVAVSVNNRAGIQSAYKIAELGYQFDCDVSVVQLPEGKDPADIILENPELWKQYLSDKKGYLTFHNNSTENQSLRERIGAVEKNIFPILARVSNNVKRDVYLQSVAQTLHVSSDSIRKEFQKFLQNYRKDFIAFDATSISRVIKPIQSHNPLMVQIHELAAIHESFSLETNFWFINNPESIELLKSKLCSKLFFTNEILNVNRFTNRFNLQAS